MAKGNGTTKTVSTNSLSASRNSGSVGAKMKSDAFIEKHPRWNKIYKKIEDILNEINENGHTLSEKIFSIGDVDKDVSKYAELNGIIIGSKTDFLDTKQIFHTQRKAHKQKGIYIGDEALKTFPQKRYSMHVFFDEDKKNFVYADGKNKYIIEPNTSPKRFKEKGDISVYITGLKLKQGMSEFNMKKYKKIR